MWRRGRLQVHVWREAGDGLVGAKLLLPMWEHRSDPVDWRHRRRARRKAVSCRCRLGPRHSTAKHYAVFPLMSSADNYERIEQVSQWRFSEFVRWQICNSTLRIWSFGHFSGSFDCEQQMTIVFLTLFLLSKFKRRFLIINSNCFMATCFNSWLRTV